MMTYYYDLGKMPFKYKRLGVHTKAISGERAQMIFTSLDPGFMSDHHHPEEQMGIVLTGTIRMTIGGDTMICEKGSAYYIPSNLPHSFSVISAEHADIIDIFSPPKEENKTEDQN